MLGGRITNQDEDEVEDELAALEREINEPATLPAVPKTEPQVQESQEQPERQQKRRPERQAMLSS